MKVANNCSMPFRCVITGVTGLLGRNLMLEIIKDYYNNLENLTIIVFGRSLKGVSFDSRVREILEEELLDYLGFDNVRSDLVDYVMRSCIKCVDSPLDGSEINISDDVKNILFKQQIDVFFHVASLTDFRDGSVIEANLIKTNVIGTRKVLDLVEKIHLKKLAYVSSAYVCGIQSGKLSPDYVDHSAQFRNPYEKTKLEAEVMVRNFAKSRGLSFHIFRPSTICGRLMEGRLGATPKFDVFYGWGIFFLKYKLKTIGSVDGSLGMDLRFNASRDAGLNIVPVDFVAKAMYRVCSLDNAEENYYLVSKKETPHSFYFFEMLNSIGIENVKMIDEIPENKNKLEDFYYKTVGRIFNSYINCPSMDFDSTNLDDVCKMFDISCPSIDKNSFSLLMNYAKEKNFGLSVN